MHREYLRAPCWRAVSLRSCLERHSSHEKTSAGTPTLRAGGPRHDRFRHRLQTSLRESEPFSGGLSGRAPIASIPSLVWQGPVSFRLGLLVGRGPRLLRACHRDRPADLPALRCGIDAVFLCARPFRLPCRLSRQHRPGATVGPHSKPCRPTRYARKRAPRCRRGPPFPVTLLHPHQMNNIRAKRPVLLDSTRYVRSR